jgi:hypothetical protein
MRVLAFLAALALAMPAQASPEFQGRRFVLLLFQVLETGQVQPIPLENNTFTTEQNCQRAGQQFLQQFVKGTVRGAVSYSCFDRGSTT